MLEKAVEKLKAEMKKYDKDRSIQRIGDFLLQQLSQNTEAAEKILIPEKSIMESFKAMAKEAKETIKKAERTGSVGVTITDEEGFEIILKYFGIESSITNTPSRVKEPTVAAPTIKEKKSKIEFNVELDF
ncbi:hypothetical protein [Clostridium tagluense]|uniref:hypothetical protein n=1 Tax=Clostridium tagluense TaxID=360422 RepID=UPI001CF0E290|nr:hypothetical protein [Clostridium tagluense]MCB2297770.1 hypothetical protein [Clostridium tagluense]